MCIDIVEIWFVLLTGKFVNFRQRYLPTTRLYFCFCAITWLNINGFSPKFVCALILWRSGLGLKMGKWRQLLTELSACYMSIFSFPDNNLSKCQWIFTKLGMCIDINRGGWRLLMGKFHLYLMGYLLATRPYFHFWIITWVNISGFSSNLFVHWYLLRSSLGMQMGKLSQLLTDLSVRHTSIFSFPDNNLSKCPWTFTKLCMCIDIKRSGFLMGKFHLFLMVYLPATHPYFHFQMIT